MDSAVMVAATVVAAVITAAVTTIADAAARNQVNPNINLTRGPSGPRNIFFRNYNINGNIVVFPRQTRC